MSEEQTRQEKLDEMVLDYDSARETYDEDKMFDAMTIALEVVEENIDAFKQVQACHYAIAHPGNPNTAQRAISENWLKSTDMAIDLAKRRIEEKTIKEQRALEIEQQSLPADETTEE